MRGKLRIDGEKCFVEYEKEWSQEALNMIKLFGETPDKYKNIQKINVYPDDVDWIFSNDVKEQEVEFEIITLNYFVEYAKINRPETFIDKMSFRISEILDSEITEDYTSASQNSVYSEWDIIKKKMESDLDIHKGWSSIIFNWLKENYEVPETKEAIQNHIF